jgi:glycine/serine hydroxymethyltransferase
MTGSASAEAPVSSLGELLAAVDRDAERDRRTVWLTANEGFMSRTAASYLSSAFSNRYYGGPGDEDAVVTNPYTPFMSRGRPGMAGLVDAASAAAAEMLGAASVNVNCLSGINAMTSAILALSEPGDVVMSLPVSEGGHYATQHVVERCGRRWVPLPVDGRTGALRPAAVRGPCSPDVELVYLDSSFELSQLDVAGIRRFLGDRAALVYDASHTMGLIMGGMLPSPLALGADALCGNTHKTLPGPHRGLIAYRTAQVAERADAVIEGGLYSSNHLISLTALCVTLLEMHRWGRDYARQVVANANWLAGALAGLGWEVRENGDGRFTRTHQVHALSERLGPHRLLYVRFAASNIALGFDNCLGEGTFIRLGTQEVTRRGMKEAEMDELADLLVRAASGQDVSAAAAGLALRHDNAHYSFDLDPKWGAQQ